MKFDYEYRTSDNVRHTGKIAAASRDAAFASLKAQGIRPGRLVESPGFFNKLFGKGKRWLAIGVLATVAVVGWYLAVSQRDGSDCSPTPRRQIYGDAAILAEMVRTDYRKVFEDPVDRFLARYAQPGREVLRSTGRRLSEIAAALPESVQREVVYVQDDPREVRELKRIVAWIKMEARNYLDGDGRPMEYLLRLDERQRREASIVNYAREQLANETNLAVWEKKNAELRKIGLPTVPISDAVAADIMD